jgi:hypothetical protein
MLHENVVVGDIKVGYNVWMSRFDVLEKVALVEELALRYVAEKVCIREPFLNLWDLHDTYSDVGSGFHLEALGFKPVSVLGGRWHSLHVGAGFAKMVKVVCSGRVNVVLIKDIVGRL